MKLRLRYAIAVALLLASNVQAQTAGDYKLEAEYLYNLTRFVEWPPEAFKHPHDPFVIGILGKNPFGEALKAATAGKTFEARPIQVREVVDAPQAVGCQILFISSTGPKRLAWLLSEIANLSILTVGEAEGFVPAGGIIYFKAGGEGVRLQINVKAARQQGLRIDAHLLSLAEVESK